MRRPQHLTETRKRHTHSAYGVSVFLTRGVWFLVQNSTTSLYGTKRGTPFLHRFLCSPAGYCATVLLCLRCRGLAGGITWLLRYWRLPSPTPSSCRVEALLACWHHPPLFSFPRFPLRPRFRCLSTASVEHPARLWATGFSPALHFFLPATTNTNTSIVGRARNLYAWEAEARKTSGVAAFAG